MSCWTLNVQISSTDLPMLSRIVSSLPAGFLEKVIRMPDKAPRYTIVGEVSSSSPTCWQQLDELTTLLRTSLSSSLDGSTDADLNFGRSCHTAPKLANTSLRGIASLPGDSDFKRRVNDMGYKGRSLLFQH